MSEKTATRTIPQREDKYVESVICDLCGKVVKHPHRHGDCTDWNNNFDVDATCVRHTTGYIYPECANLDHVDYHICPECFKNKLEPWLQLNGAQPTESSTEW